MSKHPSIREVLQPIFGITFGLKKAADRLLRAQLDLTISQFRILIALKHHPNTSQQALADFWNVTGASASRQVDLLCRKRLLSRARNSRNQREYLLRLTRSGERRIEKAAFLLDAAFEEMFRDVTDQDRQALSALLHRFLSLVREGDGWKGGERTERT